MEKAKPKAGEDKAEGQNEQLSWLASVLKRVSTNGRKKTGLNVRRKKEVNARVSGQREGSYWPGKDSRDLLETNQHKPDTKKALSGKAHWGERGNANSLWLRGTRKFSGDCGSLRSRNFIASGIRIVGLKMKLLRGRPTTTENEPKN